MRMPSSLLLLAALLFSGCAVPDEDEDGYNADVDCIDTNPDVNPGATEVPYNGWDDDCSFETRDEDLDEDGYASFEECDDTDPAVNPAMVEVPFNGIDDDCDPSTSDEPQDFDEDGFTEDVDCRDDLAAVNPGATEVPYNGLDDDCDEATLDDDLDGDGFVNATDCDDTNADVNPDATEIADNGLDDDCDIATPDVEGDLDGDLYAPPEDCDDTNADVNPGVAEIPDNGIDDDCNPLTLDTGGVDADGDTYVDGVDCDDSNADVNPGATEIPDNSIDDDCDAGTLDDDTDQDGFAEADDCDDDDATVNPEATEIWYDDVDQDCSATSDHDQDLDGEDARSGGGGDCDDLSDATTDCGTTAASAALSCDDLLGLQPSITDGVYFINPTEGDESEAFEAVCTFANSNGWTLAAVYVEPTSTTSLATADAVGALTAADQTEPAKLSDVHWNALRGTSETSLLRVDAVAGSLFFDVSGSTDIVNVGSTGAAFSSAATLDGTYALDADSCSPSETNWGADKSGVLAVCHQGDADGGSLNVDGTAAAATVWIR